MIENGILLVDKPKDWTSFDVVAKVRNTLKKEAGKKIKVGHTGTLDPKATGLLILTIGSYCKRAAEFSKLDKNYELTMKLGYSSSTGDSEGELTMSLNPSEPSKKAILEVLNNFANKSYQQTPPAYSAIKINGQRAYKLARQGKEVKIEPRTVTIYDITDINYQYPNISFMVKVSSGTYIRSLVTDIAEQLEKNAYMSDLVRTSVGNYSLSEAGSIKTPEDWKVIEA